MYIDNHNFDLCIDDSLKSLSITDLDGNKYKLFKSSVNKYGYFYLSDLNYMKDENNESLFVKPYIRKSSYSTFKVLYSIKSKLYRDNTDPNNILFMPYFDCHSIVEDSIREISRQKKRRKSLKSIGVSTIYKNLKRISKLVGELV